MLGTESRRFSEEAFAKEIVTELRRSMGSAVDFMVDSIPLETIVRNERNTFKIPPASLKYMKLKGRSSVCVLTLGDHLELWKPEDFQGYNDDTRNDDERLMPVLQKIDS